MTEIGKVEVHNIEPDHEKYVVVRVFDQKMWFYGSWAEKVPAEKIAAKFENAIVIEF